MDCGIDCEYERYLTLPTVFPKLFGPTVSKTKASPIVHTTAALIPCRILATTSTGTVWPRNNIKVAASNATNPIRKGVCLALVRSAITPAGIEKQTEAPA